MKYHISTFGCQMNEADSQRLASAMEKLGLRETGAREEADVLVLNTCVVRQGAEDKAYSYLHSLKPFKRDNPNVVIGVMGCLVGVRGNTPLRKKFPYVDVFMAPSDPQPMVDLLLQREGRALHERETQQRYALQDDGARIARPSYMLLPERERGQRCDGPRADRVRLLARLRVLRHPLPARRWSAAAASARSSPRCARWPSKASRK